MLFLDRTSEQEELNRLIKRSKPSFIVMYGRRRCGKSTLIKKVLQKKDVYYQADKQESVIQRAQLVQTVAESLGVEYSATHHNWESLFLDLNRVIKSNKTLAIDEFPYILKNDPTLPSVLQRLIDGKKLKYNLILCGSSQNAMSEMVNKGDEPLFGRADAILKIRPLAAGWIKEGLKLNDIDSIREYAVWGGIPRYWELRKEYKSLEAALLHLMFSKDAILLDEPMRLLSDDLRSAVQPYSILSLIGQGVHRPSEIAARLEKSLPGLADAFQKLIELGFIRREIPFGESIRTSKRTCYKINDPFLSFYFRFVLPNKQRIDRGLGSQVVKSVMQYLDEYVSGEWEFLCRLALPNITMNNIQWDVVDRWWGKGQDSKESEIDGIAYSFDKKNVMFMEAKWSDREDVRKALKQIDNHIYGFKSFENYGITKVLCLKNMPEDNPDFLVITPKEVLAVLR